MGVATIVNGTNIANIFTAAVDIAQNHAGITFPANSVKLYELPLPEEIDGVAEPFLCVRSYDLLSWAAACDLHPEMRLPSAVEPVWVFEIFVLYEYGTTTPAGETHLAAAQALVNMISTFVANYDLNGTCDQSNIIPGRDYTGLTYVNCGGSWKRAAKITITACETLIVHY